MRHRLIIYQARQVRLSSATIDNMTKSIHLIEQFVPEHYDLSIKLNQADHTFEGLATIQGQSVSQSGQIIFHAKDLDISSVAIDGKAATFSQSGDELTIKQSDLKAAKHIVVIAFSGRITDAMHGVYPCYYQHKGAKKELIATQFESHHAREAFPCIDEPAAKATFDVTLTTELDVIVLGNMPAKHQREEKGRLVTAFERTPRMSTYLLAWVVGELHKKTATTESGVEVNIWATPAQPATSLDFALDIAWRSIEFFNDYFGTPYPLPKADHVALPDFTSGAMENWGLLTFRETALLANPKTTSLSSKQYIATVITHELSHQWFGNLVTMKWWNNLWLNESFANMMEYLAVDHLEPSWNIWLDFASSDTIVALRRDSIDGVQAVQTDVSSPGEISAIFDGAIVYAKGARLLRMVQHYIGDQAFQAGLKAYFAKYAYGNTEGDDLWNELSTASGKDITGLMNTWILQSGFPVVRANLKDDQLTLSQDQFFVGPHQPSSQLWPIPLNASTPELPALLTTKSQTITLEKPLSELLRLNVGGTAHFITKYDSSLLNQIIDAIKAGDLQPLDRLQLLNEQTILARSGLISNAELIPLLEAYSDETNDAVWDSIAITIGELKKFVDPKTPAEDALRAFVGKLTAAQYHRLGWQPAKNEPEADTKLRAIIIGLSLYARRPDALTTAAKLFHSRNLTELDPELRASIISSVVYDNTDQKLIDDLLETYGTTPSAEIKQDISSGVTATQKPEFIKQLLAKIKDTSLIRPQDTPFWVFYLLRNRTGRTRAWQWLRDEWAWIEQTFGDDKNYDYFPRYAGNLLSTRQELDEYRQFFEPKQSDSALNRTIIMGIGDITGRVEQIERDKDTIEQTLLNLAKD